MPEKSMYDVQARYKIHSHKDNNIHERQFCEMYRDFQRVRKESKQSTNMEQQFILLTAILITYDITTDNNCRRRCR